MKSILTPHLGVWCRQSSNRFQIKTLAAGILLFSSIISSALASAEKISTDLARVLERGDESIPVIVMMRGIPLIPQTVAMQLSTAEVEQTIKQRAYQYQVGLREYVSDLAGQPGVMGDSAPIRRYKFFWTVNALMATASPDIISEMSDREDVTRIMLDRRVMLERDYRQIEELDGSAFTYGLEKIGVPELRNKHPELTGKGVSVGIIDTGIDPNHAEFKNKEIIFKDFINNKTGAYDDNGHGTHVAGTISGVGANGTQIGVAPEVKLVIGKVFTAQGSGSYSSILRAMEWMANPSATAEGANRPKVVNNSWGGGMNDNIDEDPFLQATMSWVQLEIFPSFAAGNEGPSASSVGSPGGLPPAFAIGATNSEDGIASFSSRGPVEVTSKGKKMKYTKPDVSAPGVNIVSAMPGGKYGKMSGTSMATPHATGVIALVYQAKPNLKIAQVRELLSKSSQDLGQQGMDNSFGAGRLNVLSAVDMMEELGLAGF